MDDKDKPKEQLINEIAGLREQVEEFKVLENKRKFMKNVFLYAEQEWRDIFDTISDAITIHDINFNILFANKAASNILGIPTKDILRQKCYKSYHSRDCPPEGCPSCNVYKTHQSCTSEIYEPTLSKSLEIKAMPWFDEDSNMIGLIHVVKDITEHKKIEEKIKYSEARYRNLFDNMSSGVAVYEAVNNGEDFIFKDFNKAGEKIDDVKKEQLLGKKVTEVFPGIKEFGLFDIFKKVWQTGIAQFHPQSFYKDRRIQGWRENYVYKISDQEIVAVYNDVTQRKKDEEEIKRRIEDLELFHKSVVDRELKMMELKKRIKQLEDK